MRSAIVAILVAATAVTAAEPGPIDPRDALALELADQRATVDRALATVTDKLAVLDTERTAHLDATYRALQRPSTDALARARRIAALRALVKYDAAERALLAEELEQLRDAQVRIDREITALRTIELPTALQRPARGSIARHFGTLAHERSKTTLSRKGIDFEVDEHAPVVASAAGTVRYAGELRGLDRGIVIDHGAYFTVVGKLGELLVPVGATVAPGDRIARAARHRVYLEVRVRVGPGGMLIDPEPLLIDPAKSPK